MLHLPGGDQFNNGIDTNYTYNTDDFRLSRIQTASFQDLNYTYDAVGNITSILDEITDKTKTFAYDSLDRLISANETGGYSYAYEYDPIGNLTKYTTAGKEYEYAYGEGNAGPHAITGLLSQEGTLQQTATNYTAEYYTNTSLSGSPLFTRIDPSINFNWDNDAPTASMSADNYSVRWTKNAYFEEGTYMFSTRTDDGVRLYIDNQLVIDKWVGQAATTWTATKQLSGGNHDIRMEYYEGGGGAVAAFSYIQLTDDFTGEYFNNTTLSGLPTVIRNDAEVNFNWDTASPAASLPMDNFSVRWNKVASFSAGLYKFMVRGDDGIRLYIDEELVIDGWVNQSSTTYTTTKAMTAGNHRMRIEYYDSGWTATAMFDYAKVGEAFTGEYFNNTNLSGSPVVTRTDPAVNFEWGDDAPHASVSANQYSVRWTKTENFEAGDYEFTITGDDGIRLFIDDEEVIDGWFDQGGVSYSTVETLTAGEHDVRVEYYEAWGGAMAKFSYNKVSENVALNETTNASSTASGTSANAVDGNPSTRWESNASDPQWLAVDLGSRKTINRVRIDWHANYAQEFKIQMSDNGTDWYNVKEIYWTNGGIDDVTGFYGTGRYIRMYGLYRATGNGYSINEFEAYAATDPSLAHPHGTPAIAYDANGNMIHEGIKCYEYDEANQLSKVKRCANNQIIAEYVYDYNGMRLIKKNYNDGSLANTVISWSDSFETKDIVGGSIETTNYYFANNELVAKKYNDGSKVFFHNDHLGSNAVTTNQWGSHLETTEYDPWGKVLGAANYSKFQFTGQEKDNETGLNYYNARYYSSDLRRFTQPDSIIQDVYDPQSLNRYSYVRNNPLRYTDPSGYFWGGIVSAFNNVVNTVKSWIAPKAPPPPVSTFKLPNDPIFKQPISGNGGGGNSGGGGGGGGGGNSGGGGGGSLSVGSAAAAGIAGLAGAAMTGGNYTVYGAFTPNTNIMQYAGKTRQPLPVRIAQHQLDPLKRGLDFRALHTGLNFLQASGSEQIYIEKEKLIQRGLNKINGIARSNPIYNAAKDAAYAVGAAPASIGTAVATTGRALNGFVGAVGVLRGMYMIDYEGASQAVSSPEQI